MIWVGIAVLVTAFFFWKWGNQDHHQKTISYQEEITETRGVFISYIEYLKYFQGKEKEEIKEEIDQMIEQVKEFQFNTIYLHFSDLSLFSYDFGRTRKRNWF